MSRWRPAAITRGGVDVELHVAQPFREPAVVGGRLEQASQVRLERLAPGAEQVWGAARGREDGGDDVVDAALQHLAPLDGHDAGRQEAHSAQDVGFPARCAVGEEPPAGPSGLSEIRLAQGVDLFRRRYGEGQWGRVGWRSDGGVEVHECAARLEHVENGRCDPLAVHPVERLGEHGAAERPEPGRQLLSPPPRPPQVAQAAPAALPLGRGQHGAVRVDADHLGEEVGHGEGDDAGPAADVQQPGRPRQIQRAREGVVQARRVGQPTLRVVGRRTFEQRLVPLPPLGHGATSRRHEPRHPKRRGLAPAATPARTSPPPASRGRRCSRAALVPPGRPAAS